MSSKHKHSCTFEIIERDPNVWLASCGRHAHFTGGSYYVVEDKWRKHVYQETGKLIPPTPDHGVVVPERWTV